MTYTEATAKAMELYKELAMERDAIIIKAKEEGVWGPGLDTNNDLFTEVNSIYMAKLNELWNAIDDWEGMEFDHENPKSNTDSQQEPAGELKESEVDG